LSASWKIKKPLKKGVLGYKSGFAPAITANVLTYFNGKRKRYPFKGKINLQK
jgi:hypothetical protein